MLVQKTVSTLVGIIIIVIAAVIIFGGVFAWQYFAIRTQSIAQTQQKVNQQTNGQSSISSISSSSGKVGSAITINGTLFAVKYNEVIFNCSGGSGSIVGAELDGAPSPDGKTITINVPRIMDGEGVSGSTGTEVSYPINCTVAINNNSGHISNSLLFTVIAANQNQTADWKTYTNGDYGFEMKYPSDFPPAINLTLDQRQKASSYMSSCSVGDDNRSASNEIDFCYIGNENVEGFQAATIDIISDNSINEQDCQKGIYDFDADNPMPASTPVKSNGTTFYKYKLGTGGAGNEESEDAYITYYKEYCYTIDLKIGYDNSAAVEKASFIKFQNIMQTKLESIFSTFKFTK